MHLLGRITRLEATLDDQLGRSVGSPVSRTDKPGSRPNSGRRTVNDRRYASMLLASGPYVAHPSMRTTGRGGQSGWFAHVPRANGSAGGSAAVRLLHLRAALVPRPPRLAAPVRWPVVQLLTDVVQA